MIPRITLLTAEQRSDAWLALFRFNLEILPDDEIRWEAARWRFLKAPGLAGVCDRMLRDRELVGFAIEGGATAHGLDLLWKRADHTAVMAIVRDGQCLIGALRLDFWLRR